MSASRLRPIQGIADHREREAARRLGADRARLRAEEVQWERLCRFRDEYRRDFQKGLQRGMDAGRLAEYQVFMARLDEAVTAQAAVVEAARRALAEAQKAWRLRHTRTRSLDKAIERLEVEDGRGEERREQALLDEVAGRRGRAAARSR